MKKIILTFAIIFMLQSKAFPNFEMNLILPIGMSYIFANAEGSKLEQYLPYAIDYDSMNKQSFGVNAGALMQIGTRFDLKNKTGLTSVSVLTEIGYSLELLGATFKNTATANIDRNSYVTKDMTEFHTLNLGIIPKLNFWFPSIKIPFSVGFGGGVKIPFSGTRYIATVEREEFEEDLSYQDIKKTFEYPFIPYIKLTYDVYFYPNDKLAFTVGSYLSYDFGMKYDVSKLNLKDPHENPVISRVLKLTEYGYSSLTIGISFGVSFGRPDPRPKE